jgi:hypothetical protein
MIAFTLSALISPSIAQQKTPASLEETTAWLTATLNTSARYVKEQSKGTSSSKIENVRFDGCVLAFDWRTDLDSGGINVLSAGGAFKLILADIDPSNYLISQEYGYVALTFKTRDGRETIRFDGWSTTDGKRYRDTTPAGEVTFPFPFTEKDLAERVGKAFAHAATLCAKK